MRNGSNLRPRPLRPRALVVLTVAVALVFAQGPPTVAAARYRLILSASGLNQPVYMVAPPGEFSRYFIVEKAGVIRILKSGKVLGTPFLDIRSIVSDEGERGLLSLAFHPRYRNNRRFYVFYTNNSGDIVVARYLTTASNPNRADPNSRSALVTIAHQNHSNHNGGHLQFDPIAAKNGQAILYFSTGDGGGSGDPGNNAQNKSSRLGKLLRMNVNDSPPVPQMVAYGLRNPWRFSFDRLNGDLRIGDVGQNSWEELDFFKHGASPGVNFGWRKYEGKHVYPPNAGDDIDESRLVWPFQEYSHEGGNCTVIGGYMYRGPIGSLYGHYLYADLCSSNVWMRKPGNGPIKMNISGQVPSIVSFAEGNKGGLFIVSMAGSIWRLGT